MKYGRIEGVEKPVSRLLIGADTTHTMPDTAILFDAFFELGGNAFDTSHTYGHEARANAIWARGFAIVASVSKSWCWKKAVITPTTTARGFCARWKPVWKTPGWIISTST
jgi:hypothetical protein